MMFGSCSRPGSRSPARTRSDWTPTRTAPRAAQVMDDQEWNRRSVLTLGILLGVSALVPPARAVADYIEELTMANLPSKISAVYWTRWNSGIRLTSVPQSYNTLLLFAAAKAGSEGGVAWGMNDIANDVKTC